MTSIRSQILTRWASIIDAPGKPTGFRVESMRLENLEDDQLPAANISPTGEDVALANPDNLRSPVVVRDMKVAVDLRALVPSGQTPEAAMDSLLVWVTRQVMADPRQAGLAIHTEENGTEWDGADTADGSRARATVTFTIRYRTKTNDPEAKA